MKKIFAALVVGALILSFAACGNSTDTETTTKNVSETKATTAKKESPKNTDGGIVNEIEEEFEQAAEKVESEGENLVNDLTDYDAYVANRDRVESFYSDMLSDASALFESVKTKSTEYFKELAESGLSDYDSWNDSLEDFYDVWNDGMEEYYDAWNDATEDLYEKCNDILDSASDSENIGYDEYSTLWESMYTLYSEGWEKMYNMYSDAWSELYDVYSDVWSAFFDGETDVDKILSEAKDKEELTETETETTKTAEETTTSQEATTAQEAAVADESSIRTDIKEAIDSYEAFVDEYCDFMKNYDSSDVTQLTAYLEMVNKELEWAEKISSLESEDLNDAELNYYMEVYLRCTQKLAECAYSLN